MRINKNIFFYVILLSFSLQKQCCAQNFSSKKQYKIDSLNAIINNHSSHDTAKASSYVWLSEILYLSDIDTLKYLCEIARDISIKGLTTATDKTIIKSFQYTLANALNNIGYVYNKNGDVVAGLDYYRQSLKIQKELGKKEGISTSLNNIGYLYYTQGDFSNALDYYNQSLAIEKERGSKVGVALVLNNIGLIYSGQGNIPKALDCHNKSLKIREEIGNKEDIAISLNNIGIIYKNQGDIQKALENWLKSLELHEEMGSKKGIALSLNNIGNIYENQGNFTKALDYYYRSLEIRESMGDKRGVANSLNNIGSVYRVQNEMSKALDYFNRSLKIREELGYKKGIIASLINIGNIETKQGKLSSSQEKLKIAYRIANEIGSPRYISKSALSLSQIAVEKSNYKEAFEMYKVHITMRDSLNNKTTQKATAQQQAKYEYEKQKSLDDAKTDKIMALQEKENEKKIAIEKEAKAKQKVITYAVGGGLLLVAGFLLFVFNRLRITKKQKLVIEEQKEVVEEAHQQLEEKNQEITDSIQYAKRIQSAILPPQKVVKEYLQESFILYKPKDIVAGDFYWLEALDVSGSSIVLFAAADCTGHGVPGAMVSVVCNNALNRSVREHGLSNPGEILDKTREIVITEFDKSEENVKDGMDIALCSLRFDVQGLRLKKTTSTKNPSTSNLKPQTTALLQYAGAHNPLWIIRNGEIIETKADKEPIGKFDKQTPYTTHTFELQKGDTIYLFSDGYVDQFGGDRGKKFKAKAFRELLLSIQNENMEKQHNTIDEAFENWKGDVEQIDDVCVIGVRV